MDYNTVFVDDYDDVYFKKKVNDKYVSEDFLFTIEVENKDTDFKKQMKLINEIRESKLSPHDWLIQKEKEDPEKFKDEIVKHVPFQRGYLAGSFHHDEELAHLESLNVKQGYRGRGYAKKLISEILVHVDNLCYKTNGKAHPNEKHDTYWWGQEPRETELSPKEFNERLDKLLKFYKGYGFQVAHEQVDFQGKRDVWIERPSQCKIMNGGEVIMKCLDIKKFKIRDDLALEREEKGGDVFFKIMKGDEKIGAASIYNHKCEFWNLGIWKGYQGKGIAREVYNYIESVFYSDRCDKIEILSVPNTVGFWEKVGFKRTDRHPQADYMEKKVVKGNKPFRCEQ